MKIERDVALARHTTIGTGGPAGFFARPSSLDELREALAFAAGEGVPVEVIGLGSNVLVHDDGVDALVLRLEGELARVAVEDDVIVAGGGAANAVCVHRARDAGLGGLEFASAIPGTVGGGVRMNAGAYGSDFNAVLVDAVIADALRVRTVPPPELDLSYRHSALRPGEVVAQVRLQLTRQDPAEIKARIAELLAARKATQPTNKRTFGSVFKNPRADLGAGYAIEQCGLKGYRVGGAVISPRHGNFIENLGDATSADAVALMAEARARVHERFGVELEHEVRFLGPLALPPL
ncbi:MAG: UDP-N-acetylmuramate dehydrogenase [Actinobacteria bacterium]|nr:UDP-N-acetylmuramate dehydrogenase [Actinomycetota bacterium]